MLRTASASGGAAPLPLPLPGLAAAKPSKPSGAGGKPPAGAKKALSVGEAFDKEQLAKLIATGAYDLDAPCRDSPGWLRWSPLHAAAKDSAACVAMLLEAGANPHVLSADKKAPLHLAAAYGRTEAAKLLLAAGADKAATNNDGSTAYDFAVATKAPAALLALLRP